MTTKNVKRGMIMNGFRIAMTATILVFGGRAMAQGTQPSAYCNVDFQDRVTLDLNNPLAKYGFLLSPPVYVQHCAPGDVRMVYSPNPGHDFHIPVEDWAFWNCFKKIGSGPNDYAYGHLLNNVCYP